MEIAARTSLSWLSFADFAAAPLYEALRFRQAIFVVEQRSPYPDLDALDQQAAHLLLRIDGALAGYLRLVPFGDDRRVAIGRVAVAAAWRRRGLGRRLMTEALARCRRDHPGWTLALSAQTYLLPFYRSFGFIAVSPPYDDYGVPHVDMRQGPRA